MNQAQPVRAILYGGFIAGGADIVYAFIFYGAQGVKPIRIPQSIASGLLGPASYRDGLWSASLGMFLHFFIAVSAAAIFYLVSRRLRLLTVHALVAGLVYGVAIYGVMHFLVLPLSLAPHFKSDAASVATDLAVHILLIGPAISLSVRRLAPAFSTR